MGCRTIEVSHMPFIPNEQLLVDFLEEIIGKGGVCACKLTAQGSLNSESNMSAFVEIKSAELASAIYNLAKAGILMFWCATLAVQFMHKDIVSQPISTATCPEGLEGVKLHMGCQISENVLYILWSSAEVDVEFGHERRIRVYVKEGLVEYKMELSYRDIRHIYHRNIKGKGTEVLLLQLRNAPRIYQNLHSRCDDENSKNYKDSKDVQWIRTIDFTQSCSIGQSSSLCLELHNGMNISQIQGKFAHYEEIEEKLSLEYGTPFSSSLKLVPIINSPESIQLPYRMMFKINSLVQRGILSGPTLGKEFFDLLQPSRRPLAHINQALAKLGNSGWHMCYEPVKWLQKQFDKIEKSERHFDSPEISLDNGLMYVHRVQVTPSKVYFTGPEVNVSNRVTRHYAKYIDNFLRVSFVDENLNTLYSSDLRMGYGARETRTEIYKRILSVLAEGIVIGNKKFEFLAFSSSQLWESSVWMFASADTVNADSIRKWMGDFFAIKNVAKCATRMGQSFSSSTETLDVYEHEIDFISDIEVDSGSTRYTFSDGIGKISLSLAKQVAIKCGCDKRIPSAFQIRYGGYKGVVAVDPKSSWKLSLRRSMWKYNSKNTSLDVLSWTRFGPCFLNRQIITLLSTLGVEDHHFEMLQKQAVTLMDQLLTNRDKALDVLQIMFAGENHNVFTEMLSCGYSPAFEPYLSMMLHAFRASKLLELKNKARIFVSKGRCLMGCLDETRTLKYGEVFIQASHAPGNRQSPDAGLSAFGQNGLDHTTSIVEGKVIVAKNPCLHPGDVRILLAVNIPSLHHMVDCIVFPQQGERPHPSECSGSDLDGDVYFISWDESLIPPQQDAPMDYVARPPVEQDHEVTIKEIQEHFANHIVNDRLGNIANSHTVFADQNPEMARSSNCIELAKLHSTAVDFVKTGVPAEIPPNLRPTEYPDFMEKEDKPTYESRRILGKLYRSVKEAATPSLFISSKVAQKAYDKDLEVEGFDRYVKEALMYKNRYDSRLASLMDHYGVQSEAEIVSGNISSLSRFDSNKKKHGDVKEAIMSAVKSLKKEARGWFEDNSDAYRYTERGSIDKQSAKASAWYHVTYHPDYWGKGGYRGSDESNSHFISFPWVMSDILLRIKRQRRSNG